MKINKVFLKVRVYGIVMATLGMLNANGQKASSGRMQWRNDQKFGKFIYYGPWVHNDDRAYKNGQWTSTTKTKEEAIRSFDPDAAVTDQWMKLAKEAGMRYVVFTAKHMQSFTFPMWATKTTDYGITYFPCPYSKGENPDFGIPAEGKMHCPKFPQHGSLICTL